MRSKKQEMTDTETMRQTITQVAVEAIKTAVLVYQKTLNTEQDLPGMKRIRIQS